MDERAERAAAAQRRIELAAGVAKREARAAQEIIDAFVQRARAQGLPPVPLKAITMDGHKVRTDKRGWYIRQSKTLAVGEGGEWYVLTVPGGWRERLRGVKLSASDPTLDIGRGGRDGETGTLKEFLEWVLEGRVEQS